MARKLPADLLGLKIMTVSLTVVVKSRKPYTVFVGCAGLPTAAAFSPATIYIIEWRCVIGSS